MPTPPQTPPIANVYTQPEVIARGLLVRGSTLLVCRNVAKGYCYLPGGHVEPGELAAEALAREFAEETGLTIRVGSPTLIAEVVYSGGHEINAVFHVEHLAPLPDAIPSHEEGIAFEWLDLAAVVDADLRPTAIKAWIVGGAGSAGVEFVSTREPG